MKDQELQYRYRYRFKSFRNIKGIIFDPKGTTLVARIARYRETISAIPPYCTVWGFWCLNWPVGSDIPSPFSERCPLGVRAKSEVRCPTLQKGISAILLRHPMKARQMGAIPPSAILSRKGIARYGGVSHTGPLRVQLLGLSSCWASVQKTADSRLSPYYWGQNDYMAEKIVLSNSFLNYIALPYIRFCFARINFRL